MRQLVASLCDEQFTDLHRATRVFEAFFVYTVPPNSRSHPALTSHYPPDLSQLEGVCFPSCCDASHV